MICSKSYTRNCERLHISKKKWHPNVLSVEKNRKLTKEHIPPKSAYTNDEVLLMYVDKYAIESGEIRWKSSNRKGGTEAYGSNKDKQHAKRYSACDYL